MSELLPEAAWTAWPPPIAAAPTRSSRPTCARLRAGVAHPVYDFLFTYYSLRPRQLRVWHPGYGVVLGGESARALSDPDRVRVRERRGHRRS